MSANAEAERLRAENAALRREVARLRAAAGHDDAAAAEREALLETAERYRSVLATTDVGFCVMEMLHDATGRAVDYRFVDVNPAFEAQTGLASAAGRTARELVPNLEQVWIDTYAAIATSRRPQRFENGSEAMGRWFDVYAFPVDAPERHRVALLFNDLTRRRQAELALRESEARFRNMADHAPIMLWVTEPDGRCTYLNTRWYEFTGQREADALGFGWLEAVHPDDRESSGAVFLAANARQEPFSLEYRLRAADGSYRWAIDAASPRFSAEGAYQGYIGSVVDIGALKAAEALLEQEKRALEGEVSERTDKFDRVWRSTSDLMGTAGLDGYMKTVNPAWTRLLGWSEAEILSRPFLELIDPADHAETADVVRRIAGGGSVADFVDRVRGKDGETRTIQWTAAPEAGTDLFHIVGRDVTELHRAEEALRQSQKMEAVGQLTGGIAHDFNNLLAGISGSLELMGTRIAQGRFADVERYAAAAQGAAKRAAALTHRLLAFSRRQTLEPKPTDANRLIAGMEELVRRTLGPAVQLEVVAAGGLWPTLVDPNQLENALLNLCINARDAMPDGGRLIVETANRWFDERGARERDLAAGQYVSLCVSDNGTGMAPDVVERAFEPFFTTKPIGVGTGLGLSMIYGFARQSGGQARIYSEVGQGTMVCLYLPRFLGEAAKDADRDAPPPPRAEAGETVLVIDDEPLVRMLVVDVLEDLGYRAIEAGDGPEGLKVLRSAARIDLLVTDVGLPNGMNGRQVADAARELRPGLKVLFVTGYAENAVLGHGHLAPGMHVVTKPFAVDALAARIRDIIAGS